MTTPVAESAPPPQANPSARRVSGSQAPWLVFWRWLRRMRTALYLLGVLALAALLSTLVPQEPNVPITVQRWRAGAEGPGEFVTGVLDALGLFDVYGTPWFQLLVVLLFTSLTACLIPRYRAWWRLVRRSSPPAARASTWSDPLTSIEVGLPAKAALDRCRAVLRRRGWRVRVIEQDHAHLAAERGIGLREGGSLLFHTSFYVLLTSIVLGQLFGFSGQVAVVEGHAFADTAITYASWTSRPGRLWNPDDHARWLLTLDRFVVDWYPSGQPSLFESHVVVTDPDGETIEKVIGSNDPLVIDGTRVLQLDWGYAPRVVIEVDGEVVHDAFLYLSATAGGSGLLLPGGGSFWHGAAKAPAADPDIGLELFLYPSVDESPGGEFVFNQTPRLEAPLLVFTEWIGDLQLERTQNVNTLDKRLLAETGTYAVRDGQGVVLDDGAVVSLPEVRRWTAFQVSNRPTIPWLLVAGILMLIGLYPSLYAYRRRMWVRAVALGSATRVEVAGHAFQRAEQFQRETDRLEAELRTELADTGTNVTESAT